MVVAIIAPDPDNSILGCIMADPAMDQVPGGYPDGSKLVEAPVGCNSQWTYNPASGFTAPSPIAKEVKF